MNSFLHLRNGLDVSDKTAKLPMTEISPEAVLEIKPADQSNPPYQNALMLLVADRQKKLRGKEKDFTVDDLDAIRELDRDLFPKYVIVGWTGVVDVKTGKEVKFSVTKCQELINAISTPGVAWVFDKIRTLAKSPEAFVDWDQLAVPTKELVKNSVSGSLGT